MIALCDFNKDECSEGNNNEVMIEEVDDNC